MGIVNLFSTHMHFKTVIYGITPAKNVNIDGLLTKYRATKNYDLIVSLFNFKSSLSSLPPIQTARFSIFMKNPETSVSSTYFISIFDWSIWVAISVTCLIILIILMIYVKLNKKSINHFISITMDMFSISQETIEVHPSYKLCRTICSIFMFCMAAAFSTFLMTFLASRKSNMPFDTLNEVMGQNQYSICNDFDSTAHFWLIKYNNRKVHLNPKTCNYRKDFRTSSYTGLKFLKESVCKHSDLVVMIEIAAIEYLLTHHYEKYEQ